MARTTGQGAQVVTCSSCDRMVKKQGFGQHLCVHGLRVAIGLAKKGGREVSAAVLSAALEQLRHDAATSARPELAAE